MFGCQFPLSLMSFEMCRHKLVLVFDWYWYSLGPLAIVSSFHLVSLKIPVHTGCVYFNCVLGYHSVMEQRRLEPEVDVT